MNHRLLESGMAYYTVYTSTPLRADLRAPEYEIARSLGQTGLEQALEQLRCDERGGRRRLPDDGIACCKRGREVLARYTDRVVPGRDHSHDAVRLADREHPLAPIRRGLDRRSEGSHVSGRVAVETRGEPDLAECFVERLTLLEREHLGEPVAPRLDPLGDRLAQPRPLLDSERRRHAPRGSRGLDCSAPVFRPGAGHEHESERRAEEESAPADRLGPQP